MADARKDLRDKLMHSNGTTPFETISVIIPSLFYTTITTIMVSLLRKHIKNQPLQFCIEFTTLVMPVVLNFTILADRTLELLLSSFAISSSLFLFFQNSKPEPKKQTPPIQDYVTNVRSTINMLSVVAILAVDFLIFPRKFAKTKNFGHSLMDVGVGFFMFSNGIVDGGKSDLIKSLKGCFPLLILGTFRLFIVTNLDYHVPVSEYGVHWNFFITLAVTKFFVTLIFNVIHVKFIWINASLLMISHEILLESGLKRFVMSHTKRTDFVTANKEGLVSSMGYICMYLFSAYFSYLLNMKKDPNNKGKTILKYVSLAVLTLVVSIVCDKYFGTSRKLANSAYCFWILFIGIVMTGLYYVVGLILHSLSSNFHSPLIFQAINYNGLAFFLVSNVLTGVVNISCDTLKVGPIISLVIISIYMFINCALVCILYKKQIKLKL